MVKCLFSCSLPTSIFPFFFVLGPYPSLLWGYICLNTGRLLVPVLPIFSGIISSLFLSFMFFLQYILCVFFQMFNCFCKVGFGATINRMFSVLKIFNYIIMASVNSNSLTYFSFV